MFMDDIKIFSKNEKENENLIQTIRIYSQYIGMELDKRANKKGEKIITEGIKLSNQESIRRLRGKNESI